MANEELNERLVKSLDWLETSIKSGGDFVAEQAPQVVHEIVAYAIASNIASIFVCSATIACLAFILRWGVKLGSGAKEFSNQELGSIFAVIGSLALMAFPVIGLFMSANELLKAWFAPRLFVLEYVASLLE